MRSDVKREGKNQGNDVPITPSVNPLIAPIITSDFNNILAWIAGPVKSVNQYKGKA